MMTWRKRVADAKVRGHFTLDDLAAAMTWQTCAVGEIIGYTIKTIPSIEDVDEDEELLRFGTSFYSAVEANDLKTALEILEKIEDRVWARL